MNRIILILIFFVITVSANAEKQTTTYRTAGEIKAVCVMEKDTVCIFVSGGQQAKTEPFFILEGRRQINSFRQSLVKMKEIYLELKADPNMEGIRGIPVSFDTFQIGWMTDSEIHVGRSTNLRPVYSVINRGGSISREILYSGQITDLSNSQFKQKCFMTFISEEEIQSLIDVLPVFTEEELLSDPVLPKNVIIREGHDSSRESYAERVARLAREGKGVK